MKAHEYLVLIEDLLANDECQGRVGFLHGWNHWELTHTSMDCPTSLITMTPLSGLSELLK